MIEIRCDACNIKVSSHMELFLITVVKQSFQGMKLETIYSKEVCQPCLRGKICIEEVRNET